MSRVNEQMEGWWLEVIWMSRVNEQMEGWCGSLRDTKCGACSSSGQEDIVHGVCIDVCG